MKQLIETAFTASNGVRILELAEGVGFILPDQSDYSKFGITAAKAEAIVEWGLAKRDAEIGRWRWAENPNFVVYPHERGVVVVDEKAGTNGYYQRGEYTRSPDADAAHAYFEAHPEPKPWEDAKPGESWKLREEMAYPGMAFRTEEMGWLWATGRPVDLTRIVDGQRVWPENAS
ncbi:hypothetical protein [Microbacterium sp. K24]|uniref:hypothetical protein n=1 Tax=Microbacterium sp. K24 TaxID=2305446 RepID=UPI00109C95E6|nr:hypothetical protein [Microbacterium sp. K24]